MRSAKKLIRLGLCPGLWRKMVLKIGSGVRGRGRGGDANRIVAGALVGHRQLSNLLVATPAVYPLFLHLCRLNLVFAWRIFYFVGFAMLRLIYI